MDPLKKVQAKVDGILEYCSDYPFVAGSYALTAALFLGVSTFAFRSLRNSEKRLYEAYVKREILVKERTALEARRQQIESLADKMEKTKYHSVVDSATVDRTVLEASKRQ